MLLSTAILVGLLGSLHCLGMCAPITWAVPVNAAKRWQWLGERLVYNLGRVVTYAVIGLVAGLLGSTLSMAGWQQGLSIGAGVLMILGVLIFGMEIPDKALTRPLAKMITRIKTSMGSMLRKRGVAAQFSMGLLNGLLPCGLVYAALIAAVSMGSWQGGAMYMALFGLGTLPMMLAAAIFGRAMGQRFRGRLSYLAPRLIMVVGLLFVLRGLNLGVPYLSPALRSETQITECVGNELDSENVLLVEDDGE